MLSKHKTHLPLTVLPNHKMMASGDKGMMAGVAMLRAKPSSGVALFRSGYQFYLGPLDRELLRAVISVSPSPCLAGTQQIVVDQMRPPPVREGNSCSQHAPEAPGNSLSLSVLSIHLGLLTRQPSREGASCVSWQLSSTTHPPVTSHSLESLMAFQWGRGEAELTKRRCPRGTSM